MDLQIGGMSLKGRGLELGSSGIKRMAKAAKLSSEGEQQPLQNIGILVE